jgi:23S rRNA (adenine-N6)-dimethyltransferase
MSSRVYQRVLLSQNFLKDPGLVSSLLDRLDLGSDSVVYEIGPGKGIITEQLAKRYRKVVAIEKDARLAHLLLGKCSEYPNVTVHAGDFLHYPLPHSCYKVFANIPFNITSAIVTRLTAAARPPEEAYLTMQKEAADMFLGKPHESLRTILLKPWFETEIVHCFQRSDFAPAPRVDVVMLRLRKRGPPLVNAADRQCFRDFVVYIFTHWQPNDANPFNDIFSRHQRRLIEHDLGLDLAMQPTSISLQRWLGLFRQLKRVGNARTTQLLAGSERRLLQHQKRLEKIHRTRTARHERYSKTVN